MKKQILVLLLTLIAIFSNAQVSTKVVGATTNVGSYYHGPISQLSSNSILTNSAYAFLYTGTELGIPSGAKITKIEFLKKDGGTITGNNVFQLWVKPTTLTSLAATTFSSCVDNSSMLYNSNSFTIPSGTNTWVACNITPYVYQGGNLLISTNWHKNGTATSSVKFVHNSGYGKSIGTASNVPILQSAMLGTVATYSNSKPTIRLTYEIPVACTGVKPLDPIVGDSIICPEAVLNLSLTDSSTETDIQYAWEYSPDSINFYPIGFSPAVDVTQTATTYYRAYIECMLTGDMEYSPIKRVDIVPVYNCFCQSSAVSSIDEDIVDFSFNGVSNKSTCGVTSTTDGKYTNYQNLTPLGVTLGQEVPFSIKIGTCNHFYQNVSAIFIDYSRNGKFEADEQVYISDAPTTGAHLEYGTLFIPLDAATGLTKMRVIVKEGSSLVINPCGSYPIGETEDYLLNIQDQTLCLTNPVPGMTIADDNAICTGDTVKLSLENQTLGSNVTYQWYKDGVSISGATASTYKTTLANSTNFECQVMCGDNRAYSVPVFVTLLPYTSCYCTSQARNEAGVNVISFKVNDTTVHVSHPYNPEFLSEFVLNPNYDPLISRYKSYADSGVIVSTLKGAFMSVDIATDDIDGFPYYSFGTAMWIDFNHNGIYEDEEQTVIEDACLNAPRHIITDFDIPLTAATGITGVRIVVAEGLSDTHLKPCTTYNEGETIDFIIYIGD